MQQFAQKNCIFVSMKSIKNLLILIVAFASSACAQSVNADTFEKGIQQNNTSVQLLDVRTLEEYNGGHLAGSMLADWTDKKEFSRRIEALDTEKPVYVYCLSGGRSSLAAEALKQKGFSTVIELKGGINAWRKAGKPEEGASATEQLSDESYQAMLQSSELVLVDFGATWCPPCRKMAPLIKEIENKYASEVTVIYIDGGSQLSLMKSQQIKEMPTFILYKKGEEVWRKSGIIDKEELEHALNAVY